MGLAGILGNGLDALLPRYRSLRWLPPRVSRWMRRNGDRAAVVVDVRYVFSPTGITVRNPWNAVSLTIDGKAAQMLGAKLRGRHVSHGSHHVSVGGEFRDGRQIPITEFDVVVERRSILYVAVRPPHGWLRPRTTSAVWVVATARVGDLSRWSTVLPTKIVGDPPLVRR